MSVLANSVCDYVLSFFLFCPPPLSVCVSAVLVVVVWIRLMLPLEKCWIFIWELSHIFWNVFFVSQEPVSTLFALTEYYIW